RRSPVVCEAARDASPALLAGICRSEADGENARPVDRLRPDDAKADDVADRIVEREDGREKADVDVLLALALELQVPVLGAPCEQAVHAERRVAPRGLELLGALASHEGAADPQPAEPLL